MPISKCSMPFIRKGWSFLEACRQWKCDLMTTNSDDAEEDVSRADTEADGRLQSVSFLNGWVRVWVSNQLVPKSPWSSPATYPYQAYCGAMASLAPYPLYLVNLLFWCDFSANASPFVFGLRREPHCPRSERSHCAGCQEYKVALFLSYELWGQIVSGLHDCQISPLASRQMMLGPKMRTMANQGAEWRTNRSPLDCDK